MPSRFLTQAFKRVRRVRFSLGTSALKIANSLRVMAEAVRWASGGVGEHARPRDHHHTVGQGRADRSARRAHDPGVRRRTGSAQPSRAWKPLRRGRRRTVGARLRSGSGRTIQEFLATLRLEVEDESVLPLRDPEGPDARPRRPSSGGRRCSRG